LVTVITGKLTLEVVNQRTEMSNAVSLKCYHFRCYLYLLLMS